MEQLSEIRNRRPATPTEEEVRRERKRERRESIRWLEFHLGSFYKRGPQSPYDGVVYEGPIGWDVVVICPDSRDPSDPLFREPYPHGSLDAWLICGGELYQHVHGGPEAIANALP